MVDREKVAEHFEKLTGTALNMHALGDQIEMLWLVTEPSADCWCSVQEGWDAKDDREQAIAIYDTTAKWVAAALACTAYGPDILREEVSR